MLLNLNFLQVAFPSPFLPLLPSSLLPLTPLSPSFFRFLFLSFLRAFATISHLYCFVVILLLLCGN